MASRITTLLSIPSSSTILSLDGSGRVQRWTADAALLGDFERPSPGRGTTHLLACTRDDELIMVEGKDVVVRDARSGGVLHRWRAHTQEPSVVAASVDGQMILTGTKGSTTLWSPRGAVLGSSRDTHPFPRRAAVLTSNLFLFWENAIDQRSLPALRQLRSSHNHYHRAASLAVAPDGTWGLIGGHHGNLHAFSQWATRRDLHPGPITTVALTNSIALSASAKGHVIYSHAKDGFPTIQTWKPPQPVSAICALPSGQVVMGGSRGAVFSAPALP